MYGYRFRGYPLLLSFPVRLIPHTHTHMYLISSSFLMKIEDGARGRHFKSQHTDSEHSYDMVVDLSKIRGLEKTLNYEWRQPLQTQITTIASRFAWLWCVDGVGLCSTLLCNYKHNVKTKRTQYNLAFSPRNAGRSSRAYVIILQANCFLRACAVTPLY